MPEVLFRFRNWIFFGFLAISAFFLCSIDSVFNGGFYFSVSHLWLPLAIIIFGYTWWYRTYLEEVTKSRLKVWLIAGILYPVALLMNWPYVMALNAVTGSGKTITYRGPIQHKWISHGRNSTGYHLDIRDEASYEIVTLNCSRSDYDHLSDGEIVGRKFQIGGLGIPYRWKF